MVSLKQKRQSGFTIVELLVVIIIIGILATLVVTQFLNSTQQARDSKRKTDVASIASQLEAYYATAGGYPAMADLNTAAWRSGNNISTGNNGAGSTDPQGSTSDFTSTLTTTGQYIYVPGPANCASPTGNTGAQTNPATKCTSFTIAAKLENPNDAQGTTANSDSVETNAGYYVKHNNNQ